MALTIASLMTSIVWVGASEAGAHHEEPYCVRRDLHIAGVADPHMTAQKSRNNTTKEWLPCRPLPEYAGLSWDVAGNVVVSIGDSYSSGTGYYDNPNHFPITGTGGSTHGFVLTDDPDGQCLREIDHATGPQVATRLGDHSVHLACNGAGLEHIRNQFQLARAHWPTKALDLFGGSTVIATGGGNDLATSEGSTWVEVMKRCVLTVKCHEKQKNQIGNWSAVEELAYEFYRDLAIDAGRATIRILGYPKIMQAQTFCHGVAGIGPNEADWIDNLSHQLNDRLKDAVYTVREEFSNVDIRFVEVESYFDGGACESRRADRLINSIRFHAFKLSKASLHPSPRGWDAYSDAAYDSLP